MDRDFMQEAIELAAENMDGDGGPFGAVIVKDGKVVGRGGNRVTADNDPSAHAEIMAIRDACANLGTFSLEGCEIYSSCEPCPMCLSAIYWARLEGLTFAATRADAAEAGFDDAYIYQEVGKNPEHRDIPHKISNRNDSLKVFEKWKEKTDKIPY